MASLAFDTHEYYKNLVDAGMDERHAEAIAVGVLRAHEMANLATKTDVQMVVDMAQARTDAKLVNLDAKIDKVASKLEAKIDKEISDVKQDLAELKGEFKFLKWILGFLVAGTVALITQNFLGG